MAAFDLKFLLRVCLISSFLCVSLQFNPADNYLIDCGSLRNTSIGGRVFIADSTLSSSILSTSHEIFVNTSSKSIPSTTIYGLDLYTTARIFSGSSHYTFSVSKPGRHWIRLYFYPFVNENYNLSEAKFSVSIQNISLLSSSQLMSSNGNPLVKEYSLNISSDKMVLTFTPSSNSFAYLNALEIVSVPDELIPSSVGSIGSHKSVMGMVDQALETVFRVNMGNVSVDPLNDTLSRSWVGDESFLKHNNLVKFVSNVDAVNYTKSKATAETAPRLVYGTASRLNSESDPNTRANMTWSFTVDPEFYYLVRFHFCDIVSTSLNQMFFNVFINSWSVVKHLDLSNLTSDVLGTPYFYDVVMEAGSSALLNVSIGPSDIDNVYPNAILNGLEIMKLNNSESSLVASNAMNSSSSKAKIGLIAAVAGGVLLLVVILAVIVFIVFRRRRLANANSSGGNSSIVPKVGYRFPLAVIREATSNFSDNLIIGVGGFGKVYKGVLKDETVIAIKRGSPDSQQGLNEFRTELEMLSQFRHRHLVSLIGYCDEQNELIIVYEYMENGTLKSHLYGSDHPKLSWKQRLEICIGSARGLHYLHTAYAKSIIHRDVKSANILLDSNFMAKVADFGLSKTGPELDKTHVSTAVKGSFGYLDPEYLLRQQLTEKSDVYSFGVVLFEVICGRPVIDPSRPREEVNLAEFAMKYQKKGELDKLVDPFLEGQINPECLKKFGETAEKCLMQCGLDRPSMGEVLWNLEYVLQLQLGGESLSVENDEVVIQVHDVPQPQRTISSAYSSLGSMEDLADVSMRAVFSEMAKPESNEKA